MRKYTLLLFVLFVQVTNQLIAQQDLQIQEWVSKHPSVLIFSETNYQQLQPELKSKIQDRVVVFKGELKYEDLQSFEHSNKSNLISSQTMKSEEEAQLIKNWLAFHPDIKIITRSEFQAMDEDRREIYQSAGSLILIGEYITAEDIANYPH